MQSSKLVFSDSELLLAQNREVILTKIAVIDKVYHQFGKLGNALFEYFKANRQAYNQELSILPKISKGENYLGFPWVMLDYPRFFDKDRGHLALRTFFWWGHNYLVQLQVSKKYAQKAANLLSGGQFPNEIEDLPVWAGYPTDPWSYEIPQEGLTVLMVEQRVFGMDESAILKIAIPVPIDQSEKLISIALTLCRYL